MDTRKRLAAQSEVTMRKMNPNIIRKKSDNIQVQGSAQVSILTTSYFCDESSRPFYEWYMYFLFA